MILNLFRIPGIVLASGLIALMFSLLICPSSTRYSPLVNNKTPSNITTETVLPCRSVLKREDFEIITKKSLFNAERKYSSQKESGSEYVDLPQDNQLADPEKIPALSGIVFCNCRHYALITTSNDKQPHLVQSGDVLGNWRITAVKQSEVSLMNSNGSETILMLHARVPDPSIKANIISSSILSHALSNSVNGACS
jgi:hypothetical protein